MKTNFSIRSAVIFLAVSFATVPVLLFGVYEASRGVESARLHAYETNRGAALLISREIAGTVDQFKALFEGLAVDVDLKTLRFPVPDRINQLLKDYPQAIGILLLNDKAVSVAAYPMDIPIGVDYSDREQIVRARATRRTEISGNLQGRAVRTPSIVFSVPLITESGSLAGFLYGAVPSSQFRISYEMAPLQFAVVLDAFGRVVSSSNAKDVEKLAGEMAKNATGGSRFRTGEVDRHLYTLEVKPIGWKVIVGLPNSYVTARATGAVETAALTALLCALMGAAIAGLIAFSTVKGLDHIGQQVEGMSAMDLRPIQLSDKRSYPREIRSLIGNFNNLLDRTVRTLHDEFEAISRVADTIFIARSDGQVTYMNEAGSRLFGDGIGKPLKDIIGAETSATILLQEPLREWKGDLSVKKRDGATFDGFLSSTPIFENGKLSSIVAIIQDITREKAARDAVIQSEKMITLGELVAGASHELNNPLAIVTGYSDLLLDENGLTPDQHAKIEAIRKSAIRASNVVHSLLAFARKRKPERVHTDVNNVVESVIQLKEYDLRTSGIRLEKKFEPSLPAVFADPNQMQQVLLNIINNAQDAVLVGSNAPKIVVRTELSGRKVMILVEDTGIGISRADLKKIFDPFFTTKAVGKGTGLGLSISYGIIREHGGEIQIQSQPGAGTQVRIELPVEEAGAAAESKTGETVSALPPRKFLVVDDEMEILTILRSVLSRNGSTVDSATSVKDALQLATHGAYDFIVTDIKMPGGSGIDLYKQLCVINPAYRGRIVFLTGDTSNPSTLQFLEKEGLAYFSKPFDFRAMVKFLQSRW